MMSASSQPRGRGFDLRRAIDSFNAHAALVKMEAANPTLRGNPVWWLIRAETFELFAQSMEGPHNAHMD